MAKILFFFIVLLILSIQLQAQDIYKVTADKLRVRAAKDTKSKVIGNVTQNEKVTVLDASDAKFYKIKVKNEEGWVSKDYLEKITAPANSTAPQPTASRSTTDTAATNKDIYRVTADNLRVRAQADPKSKIVGYLPENENVAVLDSANTSFFKIKVTNGEGWVSKEFLVRVSPPSAPVVSENKIPASIPQAVGNYSNIIFFGVVALILITILYFSLKYASGNKIFIAFCSIVILVIGYFCYITFVQEKKVSGTFSSNEDIQYKTFNFKSKDSVLVTDAYKDSVFTSKYVIEGEMIKLYDQQNTIMLLIRDDKTLIGEGFTRGTFAKK